MSARTTQEDYAAHRRNMVKSQLLARGIADHRLLSAMEKIPRHLFVPEGQKTRAYNDGPLPIGSGQTISQPYIVARMTELLELDQGCSVLEIGTGSGYQTAVLAELTDRVYTVERLPELTERAKALLGSLGYTNLEFVVGDGSLGYPEAAPYDAILVTAAAPRMPEALRAQLACGGRMVLPRTAGHGQELVLVERLSGSTGSDGEDAEQASGLGFRETKILDCVFVPLIGEQGYEP